MSPEVTCKHAWSLCYVELEGQKCNKGLRKVNKINAGCHCYGQIGLLSFVDVYVVRIFALMKEVFTCVDYTYKINFKHWTVLFRLYAFIFD